MAQMDLKTEEIINIANKLAPYKQAVQSYVPNADMRQIHAINNLKRFLNSETATEAYNAIVFAGDEFQNIIGYACDYIPKINEQKLIAFTQTVAKSYEKQQNLSAKELLDKMRQYQELVAQLDKDINSWQDKNLKLLALEKDTLQVAAEKTRITAGKTSRNFRKAADLISALTKNNQHADADLLYGVVFGTMDATEFWLRQTKINERG